MSVAKVAGLETEFAVSGDEPIRASSRIVDAYRRMAVDGDGCAGPDRDASAHPNPCYGSACDLMLPNGGRFYVDHAHPEYSTPESGDACVVVMLARAGDEIVRRCAAIASRDEPDGEPLRLYKNNSDHFGHSYACHENYLMESRAYVALFGDRSDWISSYLAPFLVSRIVFCGAGKVGAENGAEPAPYQISQRADFFETLLGLQTTVRRPVVNTRDEPHADPLRFRRLHVIPGDANMCPYAGWLKVGTTQIVLRLLEDGALRGGFALACAHAAMREVSRDLEMDTPVALADGRRCTAIEMQTGFLDAAHTYFATRTASPGEVAVLKAWGETLTALAEEPQRLIGKVDWITKRSLIEDFSGGHVDWENPSTQELDLKYHAIGPEQTIVSVLEQTGILAFPPGWNPAVVADYVLRPPSDSRAWLRGRCLERFADRVTFADWETLHFSSHRLLMPDPRAMGEAEAADALAGATSPADLVDGLCECS